MKFGMKAMAPILGLLPISVPLQDSGERHMYLAVNDKFKNGVWMISQSSDQSVASQKFVDKGWCDTKVGEVVWAHTKGVFARSVVA